MKMNEFPSEKLYELLAKDFPSVDSDITKSYLVKGLVEKKKLKEDKRISRVVLKKQGKDFMENFILEYYSKYKELFKTFDKDELLQLQFLIAKLNLAFHSMSGKEKFWW